MTARAWPVAVVVSALAALPLVLGGSRYLTGIATLALIYACYGVAFNIIFGGTNQLFLCLGALAGVGAYGTTILGNAGTPALVAMAVSAVCPALLGGVFSWVSARRRLDVIFIGIVTLTVSLMFDNLLLGQRGLTGGETGLLVLFDSGALGARGTAAYYVMLGVLALFLGVHLGLVRSHVGWAFRALRDDEVAARLAGVDVTAYKILAGVVGSAMLGLTGALYALHESFISPTGFSLATVDVPVLVMVTFGGLGSVLAPVVGSAVFSVIDEVLRPVGQFRLTVYGLTVLALFLGFRRGLIPAVAGMVHRARVGRERG